VQGALGFIQDLLSSSPDHNSTGLAQRHTSKAQKGIFSDHHLLNDSAVTQLDQLRVVEGRDNFSSSDKSETLDASKICVLNSHHTSIGEQLLGVVVNELPKNEKKKVVMQIVLVQGRILPVDENVYVVVDDLVDFVLHLFLLSHLQLCNLGNGVDTNSRSKHFDFVSVHWSVSNQNAGLLNFLGLVQTGLLVQQKS